MIRCGHCRRRHGDVEGVWRCAAALGEVPAYGADAAGAADVVAAAVDLVRPRVIGRPPGDRRLRALRRERHRARRPRWAAHTSSGHPAA